MKEKILLGTIGVILFGGIFFLMSADLRFRLTLDSQTGYTQAGTFHVFIADTPMSRTQGLSSIRWIGKQEGLLFLFPKLDHYGFWMKDMRFPLDLIWLVKESPCRYRVIDKKMHVAPETYPELFYPPEPVNAVLELPAGQSELWGLQAGEYLTF